MKPKNPARTKTIRAIIAHCYVGLVAGIGYVLSRLFQIYPSTLLNLIRPANAQLPTYPPEVPTAGYFLFAVVVVSGIGIAGMVWNQRQLKH